MASDYSITYKALPKVPTQLSTVNFKSLRSSIRYIRLTWVDYVNNTRYRIIPFDYFSKMLGSGRPGVHLAQIVFGFIANTIAEGFNPNGEYLYVPDMDSLRVCPYEPETAMVMGWFQVKDPAPGKSLTIPLCPRSTLLRIVE